MGSSIIPEIPIGNGPPVDDAAVQRTWRSRADLSSISGIFERFLGNAGFDRGPWMTVLFAAGIGAWFVLAQPWQWSAAIGAALITPIAALALWRGRVRLLGLVPAAIAALLMLTRPVSDLLISGDGRHVGIAGEGDQLLVLRDSRSSSPATICSKWPECRGFRSPWLNCLGPECSRESCVVTMQRSGRLWHVLMARSRDLVDERALAAACDRSDIGIADRYLPSSCRPKWLKADRNLLGKTGGLTSYLEHERFDTVAESQGDHGWWQVRPDRFQERRTGK